jgi:threonine dehydratase
LVYEFPSKDNIIAAAERIKNYIHRTPVLTSEQINKITGAEIYFKCENFQKVGAFKSRGACNAVFSLAEDQLAKGVATHSSGNHAQALARAAMLRGIKAYIVMPNDSSKVKIEAVKGYGGIITFCTPSLETRELTLAKVINETGATEIHPYENPMIIAGQATAAKELIEDTKKLDIIIAPVGGGGLLGGTALSTHYFSPDTKVIAAEPEMANDAFLSFYGEKYVPSINPQTIADGLRTSVGMINFEIIKKHVSQIITVKEETIITAMKLVWERMKILIETSAAVPLAAIIENQELFAGKKVGIIISGGNVDRDELPW